MLLRHHPLPINSALLNTFDSIVDVRDPTELDIRSRVSRRLPAESRVCSYILQERKLLRARFVNPITTIADRYLGNMLLALCGDRFSMQAYVGGEGIDRYCFTLFLRGKAHWIQGNSETTASGTAGIAHRSKRARAYC